MSTPRSGKQREVNITGMLSVGGKVSYTYTVYTGFSVSGAFVTKFTVVSPGATFMFNQVTTSVSSLRTSKSAGMASVPGFSGIVTGEFAIPPWVMRRSAA